ncbi:MAG: GNAT family N-acetyltransferase [Acidobacteria bacterium]|nr:GNAT family N-acetyltransferase [Acidobacteriota bacterium]
MTGDMIAHIRHFRDDDFSRLLQIDQACFEPGIAYDESTLRRLVYQISSHTLVLVDDSRIVGFGIAAISGTRSRHPTGHIITLDLLAEARGQGYGQSLLRELESRLKAEGASRVNLEVDVRNERAIGFYLHMGYTSERILKNYYREGRDAIRMTRQLPRT